MTKMGPKRIHPVRVRGGSLKYRAMRLDAGTFSWGSEAISRKTRVIDVVYNSSNNELVRTKTLVKGSIVQIDATPFRQWWEGHYGQTLGKKGKKTDSAAAATKPAVSHHVQRKLDSRQSKVAVESQVDDQFSVGRLYACISSRPGQSGRCDGYVLEGKELEFYLKKLRTKKSAAAN